MITLLLKLYCFACYLTHKIFKISKYMVYPCLTNLLIWHFWLQKELIFTVRLCFLACTFFTDLLTSVLQVLPFIYDRVRKKLGESLEFSGKIGDILKLNKFLIRFFFFWQIFIASTILIPANLAYKFHLRYTLYISICLCILNFQVKQLLGRQSQFYSRWNLPWEKSRKKCNVFPPIFSQSKFLRTTTD